MKLFFMLVATLANCFIIVADDYLSNVRVTPISPNAASLGIYGSIPTNYYTGQANISLPVYEFNFDKKKISIDLSYHSNGTKVTQEASWVGLGWTLKAGGCIVKEVRGYDDFNTKGLPTGNYWNTDAPWLTDPNYTVTNQNSNIYKQYYEGYRDAEPDMFYYSFQENSGLMYFNALDNRNNPLAKPTIQALNSPLDFTYDIYEDKWVAFDGEGYTYYFGTKEETKTYRKTLDWYNNNLNRELINVDTQQPVSVTAWQLDSIRSPLNKTMKFFYDSEEIYTPVTVSEEILYFERGDVHFESANVNQYYKNFAYTYSYSIIKQALLKKIQYDGGTINFNTTPRSDIECFQSMLNQSLNSQKLSSITVNNSLGLLLKTTNLEYNYLLGGTSSNYGFNDRLLLVSLFDTADNLQTNRYQLLYNKGYLPEKCSNAVDAWGYYNKSTIPSGNDVLKLSPSIFLKEYPGISPGKISLFKEGADRSFKEDLCKIGTLNSIIYPTGGTSVFDYEPHLFTVPCMMPPIRETEFTYVDNDGLLSLDAPAGFNEYISKPFTILQSDTILSLLIKRAHDSPHPDAHPTVTKDYYVELQQWNGVAYECIKTLDLVNIEDARPDDLDITLENSGTYRIALRIRDVYEEYETSVWVQVIGRCAKAEASDFQGAGLRIKSIKNIDAGGEISIKQYEYDGIKMMTPLTFNVSVFVNSVNGWAGNYISAYYQLIQSSPYNALMNFSRTATVGYHSVKEYNSTNNGYTRYVFINESDRLPQLFLTGIPTMPNLSNGLLEQIDVFDKDNKLMSREKNFFSKLKESTLNAPRFKLHFLGEDHSCLTHAMQPYKIISEQWRLLRTEKTIFNMNNLSMQNIIDYSYEPTYLLKKSMRTFGSRGETLELLTKYPFDFTDVVSLKMKNMHMISIPIEKVNLIDGAVINANKVLYCDTLNMCLPKYTMTFAADKPQSIDAYSNCYEEKICYEKYNQKGNLLEQRRKVDRIVYLWGYNGQYPVVQIEGATYSQVLSLLGAAYIQELERCNIVPVSTGEYIRNRLSSLNVLVSVYTHNPLVGVTSISRPNGLLNEYFYDSFNRLSQVKDHTGKLVEQYEYHYKSK